MNICLSIFNIFAAPPRLLRSIGVIIACAVIASSCVADRPDKQRIVGVGDIHGDYDAFETVMMRAGVMDAAGNWSGGDTILVQTGDIADRGPDTRQIIEDIRRLQDQAPAAGGQVITLVANHEAMMMIRDLRYIHSGEIRAFSDERSEAVREAYWQSHRDEIIADYRDEDPGLTESDIQSAWEDETPLGLVEHQQAWSPDGEIGAWVVGNPAMVIVGGNLFVHGGPSAKYTNFSMEEINAMTSEALAMQTRSRGSILRDSLGPLWYRGLVRDAGEMMHSAGKDKPALTIEDELDLILDHFDAQRIFIGHTRSMDGIKPNHDNRVIQIDTGMSAHYGGVIAFIEITDEGVFANNDGVRTKIDEAG